MSQKCTPKTSKTPNQPKNKKTKQKKTHTDPQDRRPVSVLDHLNLLHLRLSVDGDHPPRYFPPRGLAHRGHRHLPVLPHPGLVLVLHRQALPRIPPREVVEFRLLAEKPEFGLRKTEEVGRVGVTVQAAARVD